VNFLKGEVNRNLDIFGEEGDAADVEAVVVVEVEVEVEAAEVEEDVGVDLERVREGKTFLDKGEEVDGTVEFDFSVGIIKDTEDSLPFKKDNGISLCLRFDAELEIRGGGIVGIGDLVDKVLK